MEWVSCLLQPWPSLLLPIFPGLFTFPHFPPCPSKCILTWGKRPAAQYQFMRLWEELRADQDLRGNCVYMLNQAGNSSFRRAFAHWLQPPGLRKSCWLEMDCQEANPHTEEKQHDSKSLGLFICKEIFLPVSSFLRAVLLSQPACCSVLLSPQLVTSPSSPLLLSFVSFLLFLVLLLPPAPFHLQQPGFAQQEYGEIKQVWKACLCCAHMLCFLPSTPSEEKCVQNCCEVPQWKAGTKLPSQSSAMPLSCTGTHTQLTTNRMATVNKNKKIAPHTTR